MLALCEKLRLPPKLLELVGQGMAGPVMQWGAMLSQTERCLCNIARGLTANPEILCVHYPGMCFDEAATGMVMKILREFVEEKGLVQSQAKKHQRRPRTCIITSSSTEGLDAAHRVYHVSLAGGVKLEKRSSATAFTASVAAISPAMPCARKFIPARRSVLSL